ncbi:collagen-like repeat preface domain-containing protein [Bacillus paranthracis]
MTLLNSLIAAIAAFFANPSDANRLALLNLFTQLLNLLNELAPSPEGNFLKQLIQSIINLLQSPNPNLSQLLSLLQQFFSALAPFFFSLILDPASLQLLLNLLVQLIGATQEEEQQVQQVQQVQEEEQQVQQVQQVQEEEQQVQQERQVQQVQQERRVQQVLVVQQV